MEKKSIPLVVQTFLRDHIQTYEQLEVLLFLRKNAETSLSPDDVAQKLNLSLTAAAAALEELRASGFLQTASVTYTYQPATDEHRTSIEGLAEAYDVNRLELVKLMTSNAIARVRNQAIHTFADAFVLGKGKKDG